MLVSGRTRGKLLATLRVTSVAAFLLLLVLTRPAEAYVDPGTGGLILQLIFGGIAGAVVIVKLYWERLMTLFGRSRTPEIAQGAPPEEETPKRKSAS